MATKICTKCGETKPIGEYGFKSPSCTRKDGTRGHQARCLACALTYTKQYRKEIGRIELTARERRKRQENPSKSREKLRLWKQKNPFAYQLCVARANAKRAGHTPCMATLEEVKAAFTGACHGCRYTEEELGRKLTLDYDKRTGAFRGWLCKDCKEFDVLGEGRVASRHL